MANVEPGMPSRKIFVPTWQIPVGATSRAILVNISANIDLGTNSRTILLLESAKCLFTTTAAANESFPTQYLPRVDMDGITRIIPISIFAKALSPLLARPDSSSRKDPFGMGVDTQGGIAAIGNSGDPEIICKLNRRISDAFT